MKDRVAIEMKRYFKQDFKRVGHAARVARYAEQIGREEGGNLAVILCAAYLHDIGIREAGAQHSGSDAKYREEEAPPVAREILNKLGAKEELINEVCGIIGHHHHPKEKEDTNFKSVYDADLIANLEEKNKKTPIDRDKLVGILAGSFSTVAGKKLCESILLTNY